MCGARRMAAIALCAMLGAAACSSPSGPTPPPPVDALQLSTRPDITIANVPGSSMAVTFDAPVATGGSPPITVTCLPASG